MVGTPLEDWPNRPKRAGPAAPSKALTSPEGRRKLRLQVSAWRRVSCWACRQTIDQALLLHDDHGVAAVAEELYVLGASAICVAHFCTAHDASLGNRPTERSSCGTLAFPDQGLVGLVVSGDSTRSAGARSVQTSYRRRRPRCCAWLASSPTWYA